MKGMCLNAGTNHVTLSVTNAAGLSSSTNFVVFNSDMTLSLTSISGDLWLPYVSVGGIVSDPSASIWVNGILGTNNGDGTWNANAVPVSPSGEASFDLQALSDDADELDASTNWDKADEVLLDSGSWTCSNYWNEDAGTNTFESSEEDWSWSANSGGSGMAGESAQGGYHEQWNYQIAPDFSVPFVMYTNSDGYVSFGNGFDISGFANDYSWQQEIGTLTAYGYNPNDIWNKGSATVKVMFHTGGIITAGSQSFYEASGLATEEVPGRSSVFGIFSNGTNIIPQQTYVVGLGEDLDADGEAWAVLPNPPTVEVTLKAQVPRHKMSPGAGRSSPVSWTANPALTDINRSRTHIGVGEEVSLSFNPSLNRNAAWQTSAGGLFNTNYTSNWFTAPSNTSQTATITATVKGKTLSFPSFSVKTPSGIDHANIAGTNSLSLGTAGVDYINNVWVSPTSVSFYRVCTYEVGEIATNASGYFANTNIWPASALDHGQHGANHWSSLAWNNEFQDHTSCEVCPPPWSSGNYTWPIPVVWQVGLTVMASNCPIGWNQDQAFSIDANGTVSINKFGIGMTRTTNNVITTQ